MVGLIAHLFVEWLRSRLASDLCWGVPGHAAPGDFRESQPPPQTAKMKFFRHRLWSSQRSPLRAGIGCSRIHAPTATHVRRLSRAKPSLVKDRFTSPIRARIVCNAKANWNGSRTDSARANGLPGALTRQKWPGPRCPVLPNSFSAAPCKPRGLQK